MWGSLRVRLLLATILVVVIAIGVTAFVATRRTEGEFQRYVERRSRWTTAGWATCWRATSKTTAGKTSRPKWCG